MITIRCITQEREFFNLCDSWNRLLEASGSNVIFLTYEWVATWWSIFKEGKEPLVLVLYDEDDLIGIAPLFRTKSFFRKIGVIGSDVADYQDFIILRKRQECMAAVFQFLCEQMTAWDMIELAHVPETSPNHEFFLAEAAKHGDCLRYEKQNVAPFVPINGSSWDRYLGSLKKRFQRTLRQNLQRLETLGYRVKHCQADGELEKPLTALFEFKIKQFKRKESVNFLQCQRVKQFYLELAKELCRKQFVDCSYLEIRDNIAAVQLSFVYSSKWYSYLAAFDHEHFANYSVGRMLHYHLLQKCFADHLQEYDFLRGGERYKFDWTTSMRNLYRLSGFRNTVRGYVLCRWRWNIKPMLLALLPENLIRQSKKLLVAIVIAIKNLKYKHEGSKL